jgi:hypothetical protein
LLLGASEALTAAVADFTDTNVDGKGGSHVTQYIGFAPNCGHWDNFDGAAIKGRVFLLQDKPCWNGTWRTQLFVQSEETANQGQYCPTPYDDLFCWEGDSDYYSAGSIKLSRAGNPSDLGLAHSGWHGKSGDYRHGYFTIGGWLYVD